jgi:hypothetical protein
MASVSGGLEPVHRDVEVAALERRDQVRPVVLDEALLHAEAAGERVHDVDLEADDLRRVAGVLPEVGLAALDVGAPRDLAAFLDALQRAAGGLAAAAGEEQHQRRAHDRHGDGEAARAEAHRGDGTLRA